MRDADVIHVCATNELHAPLVRSALEAGKHVVCEKPLALDVREATELCRLAERSGRLAVLAYNYRFHPMVIEVAERVRRGDIGEPHDVRGAYLQDWLLSPTAEDWRLDTSRGGESRVVADIGSHWIDLAEVVTGRAVRSVAADVRHLHGRATEDRAALLLRFEGDLAGTCVLSQAAAGHRNDLEISVDGAEGSLTWRYDRADELWIGRNGEASIVTRDMLGTDAARGFAAGAHDANGPRRRLLAAVYARLNGERETVAPLPTFDDGARHLRLAAAALESVRTRVWVDVG